MDGILKMKNHSDCFMSGIAPFFNEQTTICACLSSLAPFLDEIILVDNHSLDKTKARAEAQLKELDVEWKIIDLPKADPVYCRLKAIEESHGAWILDFDGDEIYNTAMWLEVREWLKRWWRPEEKNIILPYKLIMLQGDYWHYGIDILPHRRNQHYPLNVPHQKLFTRSNNIASPDLSVSFLKDHPQLEGYKRQRLLTGRGDLACNLRGWEDYRTFYLGRQLMYAKCSERKLDKHWSELRKGPLSSDCGFEINDQEAKRWALEFFNKRTALRSKLSFLGMFPPPLFIEVREFQEKCERELVYDRKGRRYIGRWPDLPPMGRDKWGLDYDALIADKDYQLSSQLPTASISLSSI